LIGVVSTNSNLINQRMRLFLETYNQISITQWSIGNPISYAKGFAFGAYLLRNYGGPELLQKVLANNTTGIASITAALNEISPGMTFEKALNRYGEAMIFSGSLMPEGTMSFDKTVTSNVNGTSYTAYGFDIWNMYGGPLIFSLTPMDMSRHSISIHSANEWKNITGSISITVDRPSNPNIELYLMVR